MLKTVDVVRRGVVAGDETAGVVSTELETGVVSTTTELDEATAELEELVKPTAELVVDPTL